MVQLRQIVEWLSVDSVVLLVIDLCLFFSVRRLCSLCLLLFNFPFLPYYNLGPTFWLSGVHCKRNEKTDEQELTEITEKYKQRRQNRTSGSPTSI